MTVYKKKSMYMKKGITITLKSGCKISYDTFISLIENKDGFITDIETESEVYCFEKKTN